MAWHRHPTIDDAMERRLPDGSRLVARPGRVWHHPPRPVPAGWDLRPLEGREPLSLLDAIEAVGSVGARPGLRDRQGGPVTVPLDRTEVTPRPKAPRPAKATDWSTLRAIVAARSGGSCEIEHPGCTGRWTERHHRLRRSQGGPDHPSNLLGLCLRGHSFVHANPSLAYARGWLLHSWEDPR